MRLQLLIHSLDLSAFVLIHMSIKQYSDVIMSAMASEISLFRFAAKKDTKAPHNWSFVRKIRWGPMDHPHRWFPIAKHYNDVIMSAMASQITSLTIVYSIVYSDADQRKHQSSASLAFVRGNSPVTGEFPAQRTSNAENVSVWWHHHEYLKKRGARLLEMH